LCAGWDFPTPDGRAQFAVVTPAAREEVPEGMFLLTTRRGKQFNSMVASDRDGVTGAGRDAVFVNAEDATRLGLRAGDAVVLRSATGEMRARVFLAAVKTGNLQVHWPEGEVLIASGRRSPIAGVPD